jgi:hypothetical protein
MGHLLMYPPSFPLYLRAARSLSDKWFPLPGGRGQREGGFPKHYRALQVASQQKEVRAFPVADSVLM